MATASGSIGTRRDLMVRLGDTLRAQVLTLRMKSGPLAAGGTLHTAIYRRESDMQPLPSPNFDVATLKAASDGAPRFRLSLTKEAVMTLAPLAVDGTGTSSVTVTASGARPRATRTLYWTCSYEDVGGTRYPLFYGQLTIYLGAASG